MTLWLGFVPPVRRDTSFVNASTRNNNDSIIFVDTVVKGTVRVPRPGSGKNVSEKVK